MPIFDFKCKECGIMLKNEVVTYKETMGKKEIIRVCPECGGEAKKQVGSPMFYFRRPGSN